MRSPGDQKVADFTRRDQKRWLEAYAKVGVIAYACRTAKVGRQTVYDWIERYPDFVAAMREAEQVAVELMEDEVHRRAVRGTLSPVYYRGEVVGHVREFSDTLLMFYLKARRPDVYRENTTVDVRAQLRVQQEVTITDARASVRERMDDDGGGAIGELIRQLAATAH